MNNGLALYNAGHVPVPRQDRAVAARAKQMFDDTRLAVFQVDATMALANHIMEGAVELDRCRQRLAQDDPGLNMMLSQIEANAVASALSIQRSLFRNCGVL